MKDTIASRPAAVMLVDDNPDHVELTREILNGYGTRCTLQSFADAQSAIDCLLGEGSSRQAPACSVPDLILLDINLPGMSGIEALQQLKGSPKTKRIPVIMLTSSRRSEEIVRSYEYGANSYVVKQMDFDALRAKIAGLSVYWTVTSELPTCANGQACRPESTEAGLPPAPSDEEHIEARKM